MPADVQRRRCSEGLSAGPGRPGWLRMRLPEQAATVWVQRGSRMLRRLIQARPKLEEPAIGVPGQTLHDPGPVSCIQQWYCPKRRGEQESQSVRTRPRHYFRRELQDLRHHSLRWHRVHTDGR